MEQPTAERLYDMLVVSLIQVEAQGIDVEAILASVDSFSIVFGLIREGTDEPDYIAMLVDSSVTAKDGAGYIVCSELSERQIAAYPKKFHLLVGFFPDAQSSKSEDLKILINAVAEQYALPPEVSALIGTVKPKHAHLSVVPKTKIH